MNRINLSRIAVSIPCLIVLTSCSQLGPKDSEFRRSLQNQFPSHWEINSLEIKERENTGTKVQPNIVARFHAKLKLKEDTFFEDSKLNEINADRQQGVTFISKAEVKGKIVDVYGVSNSRLVAEKWQTDFRFDTNPTENMGSTRTSFSEKTVLKDSKEQEEFVAQVKKEIEDDKVNLKKAIASRRIFSGERLGTEGAARYFKLSFNSFDESSGIFSGEMNYPDGNFIVGVEGKLSESNLSFESKKVIKGDNVTLQDSVYNLHLVSGNKLSGQRDYTVQLDSLFAALSGTPSKERKSEEVVINLE